MFKPLSQILNNNSGIALLITISVTTILVAVALEYNRRARFAVISAAAIRNRMTMSYMASSGIQAAMAMLVKDKDDNNTDSLMDDWADPEKIAEYDHHDWRNTAQGHGCRDTADQNSRPQAAGSQKV